MADIYNPIISREELSRWQILDKIPVPDANIALVFVGDGQPLLTVIEGQKGLTRGEMLWGRYHLVYKVDMSDFPIGFRCNLPCATDAFDFQAEVQFTCSVRDTEMIVRRNVIDIREILQRLIIEVMRRVSRKYEVEQSGAAEQEISDCVKTPIYDEGFNLKQFTVTLSLEEEARERIRVKKRLQEEIELEKARQALEQQKAQQAVEEARKRENLELERIKQRQAFELEQEKIRLEQSIKIQTIQLELDKQKLEFETEQKRIQEQLEQERIRQRNQFEREEEKANLQDTLELQMLRQSLEMQKTQFELQQARQHEEFQLQMMKQKTEFYTGMLQAGQWQLLALQLAQRPEDVQVILQILNQQKQIEREHQVNMLKMLLDSDAVEGWQLSQVGKRALQELIGFTEQSPSALESASTSETERKENIPTADEAFPNEK